MELKTVTVEIEGLPPGLLMNKFPMEPIPGLEKKTPEDQAAYAAYRNSEGTLFIPGINVQRALIAGAAFSKGKGRATLAKPVSACVMVMPAELDIGTDTYEIDSRAVVVPATKGRIVRHRPYFKDWHLSFDIEFDPTLVSVAELRKVVDDTGARVGIGDFRPEKKGPFGRFTVITWRA